MVTVDEEIGVYFHPGEGQGEKIYKKIKYWDKIPDINFTPPYGHHQIGWSEDSKSINNFILPNSILKPNNKNEINYYAVYYKNPSKKKIPYHMSIRRFFLLPGSADPVFVNKHSSLYEEKKNRLLDKKKAMLKMEEEEKKRMENLKVEKIINTNTKGE